MNNELYLKTAFCCMACDGEIASDEVQLIKDYVKDSSLFNNLNVEELLNVYIESVNTIGAVFLTAYLNELKSESLTPEQEITIMQIAINMMEADKEIRYSEIRFFKQIRACLCVDDEIVEKKFPNKEDFFLPDTKQEEYNFNLNLTFSSIRLDN